MTQDSGELCSDIDFVIPWVDGVDPEWQAQRRLYSDDERGASGTNGDERYRDWGILPYWFRAVEKCAPWVRKIHFITCGQVPEWLNLNHPKLHFVKHEDYIPHEWLPTFSSNPIELNLHRIDGLAEKFVYFNDDVFVNAPVKPEDFFADGLPCACAMLNIGPVTWDRYGVGDVLLHDLQIINEHFDSHEQFKADFRKWINLHYGVKNIIKTLLLSLFRGYTGIYTGHTANAYLKSTFQEVWQKEGEWLTKTSSHRFRDRSDVNQWLILFWQIASGKFHPRSPKIYACYGYGGTSKFDMCIDDIKSHKHKLICINDNENITREIFSEMSEKIRRAYAEVFPEKSSFEL